MTDQVDYFSSDILFKKLWKSQKASNLHDFVYIKALFFSISQGFTGNFFSMFVSFQKCLNMPYITTSEAWLNSINFEKNFVIASFEVMNVF